MDDELVGHRRAFEVSTRAGTVCGDVWGAGPAVVLLPSAGHVRSDWDAVRPELAREFRTVALDWPGHGGSPQPAPGWTASARSFADVTQDVIEATTTGPVAVIGNSVGGYAAAQWALRRPERTSALVLVDSAGFIAVTPVVRLFGAAMGRPAFLRWFYPRFARWYVRADTEFAREVGRRAIATARRKDTSELLSALWRSFSTPATDLRRAARSVTAPTLAIWGRRDPVLPERAGRRVVATIPGARLALIDTGHVPFATRPAAFLAELLPFLRTMHLPAGSTVANPRPAEATVNAEVRP
jgi:pimeloyl-ACP methyl ester carboxylesterase